MDYTSRMHGDLVEEKTKLSDQVEAECGFSQEVNGMKVIEIFLSGSINDA